MRMKQGLCAALLCTFATAPALADDMMGALYVAGKAGGSWAEVRSIKNTSATETGTVNKKSFNESAYAFGGSIGYKWSYFIVPVRFEADYTYRKQYPYKPNPVLVGGSSELKSEVISQTILGAAYVDIPLVDYFGVFIGGGLGLGFNETQSKLISGSTVTNNNTDRNEFAWMGTAGVSITPNDWFALDLAYRYADNGSIRWNVSSTDLTSNNFIAHEGYLNFRIALWTAD